MTCTFHDARERGSIIVEKITDDGQGAFDFTSSAVAESVHSDHHGTGSRGQGHPYLQQSRCRHLRRGRDDTYGWNLVSSTCSDGSAPASISLSDGETVTCTFHDAQERGSILVSKVDGGGNPLAGAEFALDGDGNPQTPGDQTSIPPVEGQPGASASTICSSTTTTSSRRSRRMATRLRTPSRTAP